MVIQTRIHDGISVKTRTYRNVIDGVNLAQFREGFYAQEAYSRFGVMVQLKGSERIVLARFGRVEPRIHKIAVDDQSATYNGRFVHAVDDSFNINDNETKIYHVLELEIVR